MHRSLSQRFNTLLLAGTTAFGAALFAPVTSADNFALYEPGVLRQAERALKRGAPQRAVEILEKGAGRLVKNRHRAEAGGLACRAHLALGEPVEAREACLTAVELDPSRGSWRYLNNLGAAELALGNYDAAEIALSRAASNSGWARAPRKNLAVLARARSVRDDGNAQYAASPLVGVLD